MTNYCKNEKSERLLGKRPSGTPIDQPAELGYRCPVCCNEPYYHLGGVFDERLHWSEYNGMLWCSVCNVDYPSCLCKADPVQATEVFLAVVEDAVKRSGGKMKPDCPHNHVKLIEREYFDGFENNVYECHVCHDRFRRIARVLKYEQVFKAVASESCQADTEKG